MIKCVAKLQQDSQRVYGIAVNTVDRTSCQRHPTMSLLTATTLIYVTGAGNVAVFT